MNSIENLQWRYAVKKFDQNKSLTEAQISILKEVFNLTATSYGLQPVKLVVVKNKEIQQRLVAHSWNQQQVVDASHLLVLCVQNELTSEDIESYFNLVKSTRNTSDEIIDPFKSFLKDTMNSKSKEEIYSWAKNQAYIALGNLMTVAANERIDSCPMEGFTPEKYDEILNLKSYNLTSVLVLPVGFRAEDDYMKDLKKVRRKTSEVVIEIV
jgi:nitroreductase